MFVCTGNLCRSPLAQGLCEQLLRERGLETRIAVASAGTHAHVGQAPHPLAITVAAVGYGIDISNLRGRQFEVADFERFPRIIAMDSRHLQWLGTQLTGEVQRGPALLLSGMTGSGDAEVPDPYGKDRAEFEYAGRLIRLGVERLVATLAEEWGLTARGR